MKEGEGRDKREEHLQDRVNEVRRKLLKASAVVGGSMVLGHLTYQKPAWKSFFGVRSAWAQPTSFMQHVLNGRLGTQTPGTVEDTGQDCWEFASASNNNLTINATSLDGFIDIELYLYAPGAVGAGETNLLTGTPFGLDQTGLGGSEGGVVNTPTTGTYTICIEDQRTSGNEQSGDYQIVIDSSKPMGPATMTVDEGPESDAPDTP